MEDLHGIPQVSERVGCSFHWPPRLALPTLPSMSWCHLNSHENLLETLGSGAGAGNITAVDPIYDRNECLHVPYQLDPAAASVVEHHTYWATMSVITSAWIHLTSVKFLVTLIYSGPDGLAGIWIRLFFPPNQDLTWRCIWAWSGSEEFSILAPFMVTGPCRLSLQILIIYCFTTSIHCDLC